MKKKIIWLCVLALAFSLTACGTKDKDDGTGGSQVEEPAGEDAEAQGPKEDEDSQDGSLGAGEEGTVPDTGDAVTGEGGSDAAEDIYPESWSEEMEGVKKAVTDALGSDYWPNTMIYTDYLEGAFGLSADLYEDYFGEMPMISTNVDMILVVKPKEGCAEEVEEALSAYRDRMVQDTMQYPQNLGKIQASVVETVGDYVCFVQLGADVDDLLDSGDEVVIEHCQEQNQLALDAIEDYLNQ